MALLLPFIVAGIANGAIYGMLGTGLVLTYKTSGIFNFGYGAIATIAAYVFYFLHVVNGVNWELAFVISVGVLGPLLGFVMEWVSRALGPQTIAYKIVGTVGIILLVEGFASVAYGTTTTLVQQYLPGGTSGFTLAGAHVEYTQVILAVVGLVSVAALFAVFRWSRMGVAIRAVVDDPELLSMQATSPRQVRSAAWVAGCTFAAASGVLLLPFLGLNAVTLTFLVVQAFGAAAIGAFSSIPLTFVGGLFVGLVASVTQKYVVDVSWLGGLPEGLPFILLILVLLVLPKRKLLARTFVNRTRGVQWRAPGRVRLAVGAVVLVLLVLVPNIVGGNKLIYYTAGLSQAVILLSLGLLVRVAGQVSLCQSVFAAIGATTFAHFAGAFGIPWLAAFILGGLVVVPIGALLAVPAIRLSGVFLALATLGFGIMVQYLLYPQKFIFSPTSSGLAVPRPSFASSDLSYYYLALVVLVITSVVMVAVRSARLGRVLRGMGEAPVAVDSMGLSSNLARVLVFALSAFFAAIGGELYVGSIHFALGSDPYFQPLYSLTLIGILALAPFAEPWYAIFVGIASVIPGYLPGGHATSWLNALFGVSAIAVAMQGGPKPMPKKWQAWIERLGGRSVVPVAPSVPPSGAVTRTVSFALDGSAARDGLHVETLGVRFGGLVAVNGLSMEAPLGRITGLIGPNGAGKTTTFDAISGLNRRNRGSVRLHGVDVTGMTPAARARLGLGRTFQRVQLAESLTVRENVALGRESGQAGRRVRSQLVALPAQARLARHATAEALDICGISELASISVSALSTGQRRLVEMARCMAGEFDILLLDEPSAGLDTSETAALQTVLCRIVEERGSGILLVEHDMSLVMQACQYLYVLDFGELIFQGRPTEVAKSTVVRAAYLGGGSEGEAVGEMMS